VAPARAEESVAGRAAHARNAGSSVLVARRSHHPSHSRGICAPWGFIKLPHRLHSVGLNRGHGHTKEKNEEPVTFCHEFWRAFRALCRGPEESSGAGCGTARHAGNGLAGRGVRVGLYPVLGERRRAGGRAGERAGGRPGPARCGFEAGAAGWRSRAPRRAGRDV